MFVCLAAIVAADIAFAVDSIPAAFAITRDSVLIWMANIFALLGLRALFVLVEGLIRRFRYLDETIAIVLGIVAIKLLVEDLYKVGPVLTLVIVFVAFTIGIVASLIADRRDPDADAKREERTESLAGSARPRRTRRRSRRPTLPSSVQAGGGRGRPHVVLVEVLDRRAARSAPSVPAFRWIALQALIDSRAREAFSPSALSAKRTCAVLLGPRHVRAGALRVRPVARERAGRRVGLVEAGRVGVT